MITLIVRLLGLFALLLLSVSVAIVSAQPAATCPPQALLSIPRAGAACANFEAGVACFGSGFVGGRVQPGSDSPGLVQPGDRVPLRELASVVVRPTGTDNVSLASLAIRTSPRSTDVLTALLVGDAELESLVTPPVENTMQALGTLNVRATPNADAAIITELGVNSTVIANGRYEGWLRVVVPSTGATGWVMASLLSGNTAGLPEAVPGEVVAQPFAIVSLYVEDGAACEGHLPNGILLQTPSTDLADAVTLNINLFDLRLAGTAFITLRDDRLLLVVLDGAAELGGQLIPAGASSPLAGIGATATPYELETVSSPTTNALPINNLPRRFAITPPQTQDAIDARIAELSAAPPTPIPVEATPSNACRRSVGRDTVVWSGPGEDFEALTELEAGTRITPVLTTTDRRGAVWWQLENSGWLARANVVERGDCSGQTVPVAGRIPAPPTNTYSLERCESFNGPVRAGQWVTFEFIPPAWDNLGEATAAIRTDPGRFRLNSERYRAQASQPFRLGAATDPLEDRYLRRFTLSWRAEPGTYRITGDWLSYEPSCNLTVAVE